MKNTLAFCRQLLDFIAEIDCTAIENEADELTILESIIQNDMIIFFYDEMFFKGLLGVTVFILQTHE